MKASILALALAASCAPLLMSFAPAAAQEREYKYCLQGRGVGIPGECSYSSFRQCQASASGRALTCNINPRYALNFQGGRRGYNRGYDNGYDGGYNNGFGYGYGYRY